MYIVNIGIPQYSWCFMEQFTGWVNKINFIFSSSLQFSAVNQSPVTLWISLHLSILMVVTPDKYCTKDLIFDIYFWKIKIFPSAEIDITVFISPSAT